MCDYSKQKEILAEVESLQARVSRTLDLFETLDLGTQDFSWNEEMVIGHNLLCHIFKESLTLLKRVYQFVLGDVLEWKRQEMKRGLLDDRTRSSTPNSICLKSIKTLLEKLLLTTCKCKGHVDTYNSLFSIPQPQQGVQNNKKRQPSKKQDKKKRGKKAWKKSGNDDDKVPTGFEALMWDIVNLAFFVKDQPSEVLKDVRRKKAPSVEFLLGKKIGDGDVEIHISTEDDASATNLWEYQVHQLQGPGQPLKSVMTFVKDTNNAAFKTDENSSRTAIFSTLEMKSMDRMTWDHKRLHKKHFGVAPKSVASEIAYMIFKTKVTLTITTAGGGSSIVKIPCRTVSLPMSASKHSSQDHEGEGRVMCYRTFGEIREEGWVYLARDFKIPIDAVIQMISTKCHSILGVGLFDEGHKECLTGRATEIEGVEEGFMTLDLFCVMKYKTAKCSFWTWVYSAMMAMKNENTKLGELWKREDLHKGFGFVSPETAESLLKKAKLETFIVRMLDGSVHHEDPLSHSVMKETNFLKWVYRITASSSTLYPNISKDDEIFTNNIPPEVCPTGRYKSHLSLQTLRISDSERSEDDGRMVVADGNQSTCPPIRDTPTTTDPINNPLANNNELQNDAPRFPLVPANNISNQGHFFNREEPPVVEDTAIMQVEEDESQRQHYQPPQFLQLQQHPNESIIIMPTQECHQQQQFSQCPGPLWNNNEHPGTLTCTSNDTSTSLLLEDDGGPPSLNIPMDVEMGILETGQNLDSFPVLSISTLDFQFDAVLESEV